MTPPRRRLDISADLRIQIDGAPSDVRVSGEGARLRIDVPDGRTAFGLVRDGRRLGGVREGMAVLTGGLSEAGVDIDVVVGGRPVASIGPSARTGPLARSLGLDGLELDPPPRSVILGLGAIALGLALGAWWAARRP